MRDLKAEESYKVSSADVTRCAMLGWDPPVNWRPDHGRGSAVKVSGGGGFSALNVQAPDQPPALRGFKPSVSNAKMARAFKFPPWKGFPCQLPGGIDICAGSGDKKSTDGTTGGANGGSAVVGACPIAADTSGAFGVLQAVNKGVSTLACGASVPLTTYLVTLNRNAGNLAVTEFNSRQIVFYTLSGERYALQGTAALPQYLCKPTGPRGEMEKSIDLTPARAQFVSYGNDTAHMALRLIAPAPADGEADSEVVPPLSPDANNERYLIIPIENGAPKVPSDCASEDEYLKPASAIQADIIVETELEPGCEASAEICANAGATTNPTAPASCSTATIYPSGNAENTGNACAKTTQFVLLDRPSLLLAPNSTAAFYDVENRTGKMVRTPAGSQLYLPSGNTVRIPQSPLRVTLDEGGVLGLKNGNLIMYGPTTIDAGTGSVTLTQGGELRDSGGNTVSSYNANTTVASTGGFPMLVSVNKNISLPEGYTLPTQPSAAIRLPVPAN